MTIVDNARYEPEQILLLRARRRSPNALLPVP